MAVAQWRLIKIKIEKIYIFVGIFLISVFLRNKPLCCCCPVARGNAEFGLMFGCGEILLFNWADDGGFVDEDRLPKWLLERD